MTLRLRLLGLALAIGLAIVLIANAATDIVLGRPLVSDDGLGSIGAPDTAILHLVSASLPMIVLALVATRLPALWIFAVLLTTIFWAYSVWQIWQDSLTGFEGGANIGLGLIMLASPFIVLVALIPVHIIALAIRKGRTHTP